MVSYKDLGLVNTREMFAKAIKGGYAVPAFNFNNMEQLQAIVMAAAETKSPVILQVSKGARNYANQTLLRYMAEGAVEYAKELGWAKPQIVLHLDHGDSFELCKSCVDMGFSSVMIDGSALPYDENVALTKRVVEYAHQHDVTVEGELGVLAGVEDEVASEVSHYTKPEEVVDFVTKTGVDSLAISIGTSHGAYKFTPEQCTVDPKTGRLVPPPLAFDVLAAIEKELPGFPIVLHGSSSVPQEEVETINKYGGALKAAVGIPEEELRQAAKSAVCKINIDSDSRLAMTAAIREVFATKPAEFDPRKYLGPARDNMKEYNTSVFFRKFNFRSNVEVQLHKYTKLNVNLATTFERKNEPGTAASTIWDYAVKSAPNVFPAVYSNGLLPGPGANNGENPYVLLTQTGYREKFYNTAQSLFSLTQDLGDWVTKGLTVTVKGSFDAKNYNHLARTKTPPQYMASGRDEFGDLILQQKVIGADNLTYSESHSGYRSVYLEASVNWARSFGKHDLSALFLYQQSQRNNVGIDKSQPELALPYRHQGIAGRITYSYDNRYFIEGNFGYNGSENFSPGKRFGFFPSVAAGYVISNEKFFEPVRGVIDLLKIKASYGIVGNDKIGTGDNVRRFIYKETVVPGNSYNFGTSTQSYAGTRLGDWANPNVGWEEAHKLNVGVDLSLFSKLKISADYFKERREGIFLKRASIPVYVGLSTKPWVNIGKMRNSGVDASLEYHQTIGQDLHLTVRGNFTYARNMIVDQDQPDYKYLYMNRTGQARYQTFGLVAAGLFRDQADIDAWPKQSFGDVEPGDIKYLDLNGDGVVDSYDVKPIGYTAIPEIVYGFGFSLQWKAFDFSAFFQGVGHVNFSTRTDQTQGFIARNSREANLFSDVYDNYWTPERLDAKYPRLFIGTNNNNNQNSSFWMANGRYMRLKNLEIGYTLPKHISQKMAMQNMRVYLSGVNLFTFSPFKLWDPDLQTGATNYPNNRIINIGLTIGF